MSTRLSRCVALATLGATLWWSVIPSAQSPAASGETPEARARAILRELIEIPTTSGQGATPKAARAIVGRLIAAGFIEVTVMLGNPGEADNRSRQPAAA